VLEGVYRGDGGGTPGRRSTAFSGSIQGSKKTERIVKKTRKQHPCWRTTGRRSFLFNSITLL
jgi:hypothetical protein